MVMLDIGSASGLCNRLRLIWDWRATSWGAPGKTIRFRWQLSNACKARWEELFEPVDGLVFTYRGPRCKRWNVRPRTARGHETILDLRPVAPIAERIAALRDEAGERFAAAHVRRTDIAQVLQKYNAKPVPDSDYFTFFEQSEADRFFLATDNAKTQNAFRRRYGARLLTSSEIAGYGSSCRPVRTTTVSTAVVDLYLAAAADQFMGTRLSSFSWQIKRARKAHKTQGRP